MQQDFPTSEYRNIEQWLTPYFGYDQLNSYADEGGLL